MKNVDLYLADTDAAVAETSHCFFISGKLTHSAFSALQTLFFGKIGLDQVSF